MIASTLIILAVFLFFLALVAGGVILFILSQRQKEEQAATRNKEFTQRQQSAVWASATIISARGGVVTGSEAGVSQWARYDLSLQVTPPNGEPYSARTNWLVDVTQMSMLQPGQQISVKIDQQDPKIIYPNANWAKYIPA